MYRFRLSPVCLCATVLAAGELLGLRSGPGFPPAGIWLGLSVLAAAVALPAVGPSSDARPSLSAGPSSRTLEPGSTSLVVAACLLCASLAGVALGEVAARRAASSCLLALRDGQVVRARGEWPAAHPSAREWRMHRPVLRAAGRECRPAELRVRRGAFRGRTSMAGSRWVVGRWRRAVEAGGWPRASAEVGWVRADSLGRAGGTRGGGSRVSPLARLRSRALARLTRRLPRDVAPAGAALLLADREGLSPRSRARFADAGLAHLLAISGMHVGLLAGSVLLLLGLLTRSPLRYPFAAGLMLGYVALIGLPPSAVRAALLFAGYAAARTRGSPLRLGDLLGLTALCTLVLSPLTLLDASFQLSFAGFGGVLLGDAVAREIGERARRNGRRGWAKGRRALALRTGLAGVGAHLCTAPLVAADFQRAAPVAILATPAAALLLAPILGTLALVLVLPGFPARLPAAAASVLLRWLDRLAAAFAALPGGHRSVPAPSMTGWIAALGLLASVLLWLRGRRVRGACLPAALGLAVTLAAPAAATLGLRGRALLCTLDVGQGDAAVLRTRRGHWILFDAGPLAGRRDAGLRVVAPFVRNRGGRAIDLFVLSHPHMDHLGGALELRGRLPLTRVLDAGNPLPSPEYGSFLSGLERTGAAWLPARPGAGLRMDGVRMTVLGPVEPREEQRPGDGVPRPLEANEASVVLRVHVGSGFVYLNTGDASAAEESRMLARWPADSFRAVLLKVGHHGSRGSSSSDWLAAVRPRAAVISVGAGNRYGHPHRETLARLRAAGVPLVWRTDRDGTLCLEIDRWGAWRITGSTSGRDEQALE